MAIKIDLQFVDEMIEVRQAQHGGAPGAPQKIGGLRIGQALNRSWVVMMSAMLQAYVEEVFLKSSNVRSRCNKDTTSVTSRPKIDHWGNPNVVNVNRLFVQLCVPNVLTGLSWPKCDNETVSIKLNEINQIRNQIAHGKRSITIDKVQISLTLKRVEGLRNFCEAFAGKFENHVLLRLQER